MKRILFFDGFCNLCDGLVSWALPKTYKKEIYFAPLQGITAFELLKTSDLTLKSVVYYRDKEILKKSQAIIYFLYDIGRGYRFLSFMLRLLPLSFADFIYDFIAKHRYKIFGKKQFCRLPKPHEKNKFLE